MADTKAAIGFEHDKTAAVFDGPTLTIHSFLTPRLSSVPKLGMPVVLLHNMDYIKDDGVDFNDERVVGIVKHTDSQNGMTVQLKRSSEAIIKLLQAGLISTCADAAHDATTDEVVWVSLRFKVKRRYRWFACE